MNDNLIASKITTPALRPNLVLRDRLMDLLSEGLDRKLNLVSAPAGYGKTTLISEWVHNLDRRVAWLSLDAGENDPVQFMAYTLAALQQCMPDFGLHIQSALDSSTPPNLEDLMLNLIRSSEEVNEPTVLILDDYHTINRPEIHAAVFLFLQHQPVDWHTVLITREDPGLPLAKMRVRGEVQEIRAQNLRFTREEALKLYNNCLGLQLSMPETAMLEARTEGWIAGLLLAGHSLMNARERWEFLKTFGGGDRHVTDYLVDEVLSGLPDEVRLFLLRTSLLTRMNAELCQTVAFGGGNPSQSQQILEDLERDNLFIVALDQRREWFRYHHLFGELLQSLIQVQRFGDAIDAHQRASEWFEMKGDIDEAIRHALATQDQERAITLIEDHGWTALSKGEARKLLIWLDKVRQNMIRKQPILCVLYAWALWFTNFSDPSDEIEAWLRHASQDSTRTGTDLGDSMQAKSWNFEGHIQAIRAALSLFHEQDPAHSIELAQLALDCVDENDHWLRSILFHLIAATYLSLGDLEQAIEFDELALQQARACEFDYVSIGAHYDLAMIAKQQGRLRDAETRCIKGIREVIQRGKEVSPVSGMLHILHGRILLERNDLPAAERLLKQGVEMLSLTTNHEIREMGRVDLTRLYQTRKEWAQAREIVAQIRPTSPWAESILAAARALLSLREAEYDPVHLKEALEWLKDVVKTSEKNDNHFSISIYEGIYSQSTIALRVSLAEAKALSGPKRNEKIQQLLQSLESKLAQATSAGWDENVLALTVLQSLAQAEQGDLERAVTSLKPALKMAQPEGYVQIFVDEGAPMARLLYALAEENFLPEYVGRILSAYPDEADAQLPLHSERFDALEKIEPLSTREIEVLELIAQGLSNREIAHKLFISQNTVKGHLRNIFGKLMVNNRTHAASKGRMLGLLPSE